ncbi:hypothetical protein Pst134EA_022839 [Puccinia striiformis f. sp. tritici]|uniref:hypothetical protein n=1 Tax=Puccinia striiformis f. sp. tritici TaxID=168172 RepID=UPI002008E595|nr:hypothetical protein Pst134EA_022839 [Puccinia striiformis f. sp. tritici]KAH9455370.1 hypothetical protein Pst134EA_022839 [Puccinia striiformis f. sp. tritici]
MQPSDLPDISNEEFEGSSASSSVSYPDRSDFPDILSESDIKEAIASLVSQGQPGSEILRFLQQECGVPISLRTLNRWRAEWGLRNCDLPKQPLSYNLSPQIKASILCSHQQQFTVSQMRSRLTEDTGQEVSHRTIERYLACLDLKQQRNDIADGKILIQEYQTHIPRLLVNKLLGELDAQGMAERLRHACKRRVFRVDGPNHIWSADGHDKLKPYGITVYGFIDAWSRKILGMYAHVTNNDPRHVGVYFLQLAAASGGIPLKVTTDHGTETMDKAAYQIQLTQNYGGITFQEANTHMHFTKSIHNQKIESLWSRMMKEHNRAVIDIILKEMEDGSYNQDNKVQRQAHY